MTQHTWALWSFSFTWPWANCSSPEEWGLPPPALLVAGLQLAVAGIGSQEWLCPADVASSPWRSELRSWAGSKVDPHLLITEQGFGATDIRPPQQSEQQGSLLLLTTNGETEAGLADREETLKLI